MNIVYVSNLRGKNSQGPYYSVPAQIFAQSKHDTVFWYNISPVVQDLWLETGVFHGINEYPTIKIADLPSPFNKPDIVLFQEFYCKEFINIGSELTKMNVPYIIIPRGSFTKGAQKKKKIKKMIGNLMYFKKFARKASSIQYLTEDEYNNSSGKWNNNYLIVPNGIEMRETTKKYTMGLKGCYIGRFDPYHKGLDILIEACTSIQAELRTSGCTIHLYGPERLGFKAQIEKDIKDRKINDLLVLHEGVFDKEKENVLLESDFFIMTSRFEGHPMGLIEALSFGLPCLVTKGTNMSTEVNEYDAGWTADNDSVSVANSLRTLMNDRTLFPIKGNNAFSLAKKYDWDILAKKSREEYAKIVKS